MEIGNRERYYNELRDRSFKSLMELAEMPKEDREIVSCEAAMNAMKRILKFGSFSDAAEGLRYYVDFLQSKNEIVENMD